MNVIVNEKEKSPLYRWVDPPSGWRYGFPKIWNGEGDLREWIISKGYPKREIDRMGDYFFIRQWEPTVEDDPEEYY